MTTASGHQLLFDCSLSCFLLGQNSCLQRDLADRTPTSPDSYLSTFQLLLVISSRAREQMGGGDSPHHVPLIGNRHLAVCTSRTAGAGGAREGSFHSRLISSLLLAQFSHTSKLNYFNNNLTFCSSVQRFYHNALLSCQCSRSKNIF